MHKKYLLIIGMVLLAFGLRAQNDPISSLNMFNHMFYNPGYAGDGNEIESKLLVREQWMGFEGRPQTQFLSVDAPFKLFGARHGAGLSIVNDNFGLNSNVGLNISYAYRKSLIQGELGIGVGLNMISHSYEGEWVSLEQSDPAIPEQTDDTPLSFDFNLGLFYKADNLYLSISSRNMANTTVNWNIEKPPYIGRQVYFATGYEYQLPNPMFSIEPGAFIATDFSVTQLSLSGILTYNKRFYGGIGYRGIDAAMVIAGISLPSGIDIAVSYDINTSRIIKHSTGSFEFMLGYSFNLDIDKDARKYKSVRFL